MKRIEKMTEKREREGERRMELAREAAERQQRKLDALRCPSCGRLFACNCDTEHEPEFW